MRKILTSADLLEFLPRLHFTRRRPFDRTRRRNQLRSHPPALRSYDDRLSRHRELLGSSKVVFLSPGVAVERVTSAVVLSLVGSVVTLSACLPDDDHVRADEVHEMH